MRAQIDSWGALAISHPNLVALWTNHGLHQQPQAKPSQEFATMNRYHTHTLQVLVC